MHPILFRFPAFHAGSHFFPGVEIYTYGVMVAIAFVAALWLAMRRASAVGIPPERISDLALILMISGIAGSRLLFVLEDWPDYKSHFWNIFNIREGGLSIHGGLILAFIAGTIYAFRKKLPFWKTADVLAAPLAVGMGIGRIGCFFNGCCYGIATKRPWGVIFPGLGSAPRHPTELYEMALDFLIAAMVGFGFKKSAPGTAFLWFWILIGLERFFIEFIRGDVTPLGVLTVAQWLSLGLILAASLSLFILFWGLSLCGLSTTPKTWKN